MLSDICILVVFALGDLIYETLVTLIILLGRRSQAGMRDVTTTYSKKKSRTFFNQIIEYLCETYERINLRSEVVAHE